MKVDLFAVKEQLRLLGHSVPDATIQAFLDEMDAPGPSGLYAIKDNSPQQAESAVDEERADGLQGRANNRPGESTASRRRETSMFGAASQQSLSRSFTRDPRPRAHSPDLSSAELYRGRAELLRRIRLDDAQLDDDTLGLRDLSLQESALGASPRAPAERNHHAASPEADAARPRAPLEGRATARAEGLLQQHLLRQRSILRDADVACASDSEEDAPEGGEGRVRHRQGGGGVDRCAQTAPPRSGQGAVSVHGHATPAASELGHGRRVQSAGRSSGVPSTAGSRASRLVSARPIERGAHRTDRVARYNQLNAAWTKDAFLQHSKARPIVGFQAHFAMAHAHSEASAERAKRSATCARSRRLAPNTYVPPTEKRRDDVRWDTRVRLQMQE